VNQGTLQQSAWLAGGGVRHLLGSRWPRRGGFGPGTDVAELDQAAFRRNTAFTRTLSMSYSAASTLPRCWNCASSSPTVSSRLVILSRRARRRIPALFRCGPVPAHLENWAVLKTRSSDRAGRGRVASVRSSTACQLSQRHDLSPIAARRSVKKACAVMSSAGIASGCFFANGKSPSETSGRGCVKNGME